MRRTHPSLSPQGKIGPEIEALVAQGKQLLIRVPPKKPDTVLRFAGDYQPWYTRGLSVVGVLLPDRLAEFRGQYERDPRRKSVNEQTFTLADYVQGLAPGWWDTTQTGRSAFMRLNVQVAIVESALIRLDDLLANLRGVLQADLSDSELEAAGHLEKSGHFRAAGAVAGVVLEGHLAEVCGHHQIKIGKKVPHISDMNDSLKNAGIFDIANWRWIQRLADIRNLCDHKKQRDPTADEVRELIEGVDKAIKTLR